LAEITTDLIDIEDQTNISSSICVVLFGIIKNIKLVVKTNNQSIV
jgi:hypothetical protein